MCSKRNDNYGPWGRVLAAALFVLVILLSGCTAQKVQHADQQVDPGMYQRVDGILSRSRAAVNPYPIYSFQFAVIKDKTPNAWVNSQKGVLVVTTGLLTMLDDNELSLILLHENAHIKYEHAAKNALLSEVTSAAFTIGGLFLPGVGYGNLLANPLITSGYSRSQELEADRDVVNQCYLMGLNPDHYVAALEKMRQYAATEGKAPDTTGLFDTHPNLQYRIDAINQTTGRSKLP